MQPKPDAKRRHWPLKVINVPCFEKELHIVCRMCLFAHLSRQTKRYSLAQYMGTFKWYEFYFSAWNADESYYAPSYNKINVLQEH